MLLKCASSGRPGRDELVFPIPTLWLIKNHHSPSFSFRATIWFRSSLLHVFLKKQLPGSVRHFSETMILSRCWISVLVHFWQNRYQINNQNLNQTRTKEIFEIIQLRRTERSGNKAMNGSLVRLMSSIVDLNDKAPKISNMFPGNRWSFQTKLKSILKPNWLQLVISFRSLFLNSENELIHYARHHKVCHKLAPSQLLWSVLIWTTSN